MSTMKTPTLDLASALENTFKASLTAAAIKLANRATKPGRHVPRELKVDLVPQELGVSIRALPVGNVPSRRRRFLNVVGPLWGLIASQALIWALLVLRT